MGALPPECWMCLGKHKTPVDVNAIVLSVPRQGLVPAVSFPGPQSCAAAVLCSVQH